MTDIDNTQDIIDVRDIIDRFEELEGASHDEDGNPLTLDDEDIEEARLLDELLDELNGNGGDHQWRGAWYPVTLIRDSYFETYARELAEDIGAIDPDASWPLNRIDWEAAVEDLQVDYSTVEYEGVTYWYR